MDLQLTEKRALVTGSSAGIGMSIAKVLAQEGTVVTVHGRDENRTRQVAEEIVSHNGKAFAVLGDLTTDEGARQVAEQSLSLMGGVDILVNNAGIYGHGGWLETTSEDWVNTFNVNVVSMVRLIRYLVPQMKNAGWGRIIQIASGEAERPLPKMPDYAASKAVNVNMTVSLAKELANTGITVNTISPGIIVNDHIRHFFLEVAKERGWGTEWAEIERHALKEWLPNSVGHFGKVEDVASLVAFVASPLSGYITGANIRVDGGSIGTIN